MENHSFEYTNPVYCVILKKAGVSLGKSLVPVFFEKILFQLAQLQ